MRKLLLLAGIFTVLAYNAQARYYEEDGYYYEEQPRYEQRQVRYREEPRYTRQSPQYRRISREEERNYNERRYIENNQNTVRPYIGLDVATTSMKFGKNDWMKTEDENWDEIDGFGKSNKAFSLVAGAKFNQNFGLEAFYQKSGKESKDTYEESYEDFDREYNHKEKSELSYVAYGIDAIGYMPITQEVELLASLGIAQYDFKTKYTWTESGYDEKYSDSSVDKKNFDTLGFRIGLGTQYNINEHFALRAMARYVKMDDDEYVKSLTEFSLGLRYMF